MESTRIMGLQISNSSQLNIKTEIEEHILLREINSLKGVSDLKEKWNLLFKTVKDSTPFQSWEWNYGLARTIDSSARIKIVAGYSKNGRLIGLAPFKLRNSRIPGLKVLEFIGSEDSDYLDFIVDRNYKNIFIRRLFNWIRKNNEWRVLNLLSLRKETKELILPYFPFEFSEQIVSPYLKLPSSFEKFKKELPKSRYKSIKKRLNKLLPEKRLEFSISESMQDIHNYMDSLFELHQKRWNGKGERGKFHNEEWKEQFRDLSLLLFKANMLKIGILKIDSSIVSVHYHLIHKDKEYGFLNGMDPDYAKFGPSNLLHYYMIEDAIKNGTTLIDFLQGNEQYKYSWTNEEEQLYSAVYARTKPEFLIWKASKNLKSTIYNSKIIKSIYTNTVCKLNS
jgi:CelD/BcsL family acetyltransferase involved in cellulose biosynthesis